MEQNEVTFENEAEPVKYVLPILDYFTYLIFILLYSLWKELHYFSVNLLLFPQLKKNIK